ncbi:hypothetical protein AAFF_G00088530 [Aldrovandia affinis]|uniref:Uncharacterized protein n=1 Tax=Aldrovandia affinis TaxID=143900 RepID=A0AAD7RW66_9TELE|nr:hypothetical protein AAFF_G00088530 [Aldrovandia affinis]
MEIHAPLSRSPDSPRKLRRLTKAFWIPASHKTDRASRMSVWIGICFLKWTQRGRCQLASVIQHIKQARRIRQGGRTRLFSALK